jgi:FKBP-type peptidyl-prolyl cis-trans isomerase SlyD
VSVRLHADEAFGEYDAELVQTESSTTCRTKSRSAWNSKAPPRMKPTRTRIIIYRVTEIDGNQATLDGNHPLAGQALIFNRTVAAIRPASADEIANGSVDSDA